MRLEKHGYPVSSAGETHMLMCGRLSVLHLDALT
jgi:hypothetical protein